MATNTKHLQVVQKFNKISFQWSKQKRAMIQPRAQDTIKKIPAFFKHKDKKQLYSKAYASKKNELLIFSKKTLTFFHSWLDRVISGLPTSWAY